MNLETYDLRDPQALIDNIAAKHTLEEGLALLAVVADPSTHQAVAHVRRLPVDCRVEHYMEARELLRETMQRLPLPGFAGPDTRHLVVTVLVRPGLTTLGRHESQWLHAWRYCNHLKGAFDGDIMLVTEHGWVHWPSDRGGPEPRMKPSGRPPGRVLGRVPARPPGA